MADKMIIAGRDIERRIFLVRGQRVMIDHDLAILYGVKTKYLNQQVDRNKERFPEKFMFRLESWERDELVAICNRFAKLKHSSSMPRAFTEHGVSMLASVLRGDIAVKISITIIETFIRLKEVFSASKELGDKLRELELKVEGHDRHIRALFEAIRALMPAPEDASVRKIGFRP